MLNWPAFGDALWLVSDQTGIRPEWQLPVISLETAKTFDPAIMNAGGCVGLNQLCPSAYAHYVSVPRDQYRKWSASQQLGGPILDYWSDAVRRYGPIQSATRLMIAQLGHGLLPRATTLESVIFASPSIEYAANSGLDQSGKGAITVQDIATAVKYHARTPEVRRAIAKAYTMRPGERPLDPVYGPDFGSGAAIEITNPPTEAQPRGAVAFLGVLALAGAAGLGTYSMRRRWR